MKLKTIITIFAAGSMLLNACTDIDPAPVISWDPSLLISTSGWVLSSQFRESGTLTENLLVAYPNCLKDNVYLFHKEKYEIVEGPSKCASADSSLVESGNWKIEGGVITFSPEAGASSRSFTLVTLLKTGWEISEVEIGPNGKVKSSTQTRFVALDPI